LAGDWGGRAIAPHVPSAKSGIAAEFFRRMVLSGRDFKSTVSRDESPVDLALLFAGDSRVIALAAAPPMQAGVARLVPVSKHAQGPAFLPTPENLRAGDYPLQLPLRVAYRRESARALQPLFHFLFSDELAPLLERAGVLPLSVATRRQQAAELEKM
jgi:ABC-type phosphate transport system substrate-binding protein